TVLVVDDSYTSRYLLHTVLEYRGYHSVEARTGALALGMLSAVQPAVVVCDVVMADMDGYQLARQMKTTPAMAAVPVIFYTSTYPSCGARPTAEQLLLGPVVAKTGEVDVLVEAVEDMLGHVAASRHFGAA
ncbi:MAG TPA: response regulator, partial [Mycobacterium sp.]